jgi:hypothetical protein
MLNVEMALIVNWESVSSYGNVSVGESWVSYDFVWHKPILKGHR